MPTLRGYACPCGSTFEHLHMSPDDSAQCPGCARVPEERDEVLGGTMFNTIVPMYKGSLKHKAGYVHSHADRPAEKGLVAVPRKGSL